MDDAATFAARVRELFGGQLTEDAGVLHVTSVWEAPDGCWRSLRVGPGAPASESDAFVLALGRARADAIITSGAILRAEPELCHQEFARFPGAQAWRSQRLGKPDPPKSVVLTRRPDLDLDHPLFARAAAPVLVLTNPSAGGVIRDRAAAAGRAAQIEVVGRESTALRDVVEWLREDRGCRTVTVESGVSTSRALYDAPVVVDELLLSVYSARSLDADFAGEAFLAPGHPVRARFSVLGSLNPGAEAPEPTRARAWRFERHCLVRSPP